MARWCEPTEEQVAGHQEWIASRPEPVKSMAARFEPWSLYRMAPNGERVTIAAFCEDGTVRVTVSAAFNQTLFERSVFGVNPDNLTPCDLPADDEPLGAILSDDERDAYINTIRAMKGLPPLEREGT